MFNKVDHLCATRASIIRQINGTSILPAWTRTPRNVASSTRTRMISRDASEPERLVQGPLIVSRWPGSAALQLRKVRRECPVRVDHNAHHVTVGITQWWGSDVPPPPTVTPLPIIFVKTLLAGDWIAFNRHSNFVAVGGCFILRTGLSTWSMEDKSCQTKTLKRTFSKLVNEDFLWVSRL